MKPCPICGMENGKPWGGVAPCRSPLGASPEAARAIRDDLKRRGCVVLNDN